MIGPFDPSRIVGQVAGVLGGTPAPDRTSTDAPHQAAGREQLEQLARDWKAEADLAAREDDTYSDGLAAGLRKAALDLARVLKERQ